MSLDPGRSLPKDERDWIRFCDQQRKQKMQITVVVATTYTVDDRDDVIIVDDDTAGGAVTVTLPPAAANKGRELVFKKIGSTGNMVLDGNASETIDNATTNTSTTQYDSVRIVSDGAEWWTV